MTGVVYLLVRQFWGTPFGNKRLKIIIKMRVSKNFQQINIEISTKNKVLIRCWSKVKKDKNSVINLSNSATNFSRGL